MTRFALLFLCILVALPAFAEESRTTGKTKIWLAPPSENVKRAKEINERRAAERMQRRLDGIGRVLDGYEEEQRLAHERYIADAPVRQQYYSALSNAYLAEAALANERASWQRLNYPNVLYVVPAEAAPYRARSMYWDLRRGVLVRPGDPSWYPGW
jgi:hypothetical protein